MAAMNASLLDTHPDFEKGMVVGPIAGFVAGALVLGLCFWASAWPVVTEVFVIWAFCPWGRSSDWLAALAAFGVFALVSGVLAAF
jgi:hypothetical protein